MDRVTRQAMERVEQSGIIFLDEIDKIASRESGHGPDVSREGVQRDLLPIVEGSTVTTKYGMVKTDHILFIASGAFYVSKPSDLIPELQGRFPIRVELNSLSREDFISILTEPQNALIKQYIALMETEGVKLVFKQDAIERLAEIATTVNEKTENIGARRLHTIMERLLEDYSFEAPEMKGEKITLDAAYVTQKMEPLLKDEDLSRYILIEGEGSSGKGIKTKRHWNPESSNHRIVYIEQGAVSENYSYNAKLSDREQYVCLIPRIKPPYSWRPCPTSGRSIRRPLW